MNESKNPMLFSDRLPRLTLKRRTAERERAQHPWVFSNEFADSGKKIQKLPAGALVEVLDCHGNFMGTGFYHPHSLIAVRILSRRRGEALDMGFFTRKMQLAIAWRNNIYGAHSDAKATYRAIFGESDGLPGLVVDRFADVWVMQFHSLGMWNIRDVLIAALRAVVENLESAAAISCVIGRTDVQSQMLEGLEKKSEILFGELPKAGVWAHESGIKFPVDPMGGQKTGFYFDQRENRRLFQILVRQTALLKKIRIADIYCHLGAWGLMALQAGVEEAVFVDSSQSALEAVQEIAKGMGFADRCRFICDDAADAMKKMKAKQFDFLSLDPPSFIPNKKSVAPGMRAYGTVNGLAANLVAKGGLLATSSCSHHCQEDRFEQIVSQAVRKIERDPKIVYRGGAALDHPIRPGMPETKYLKNLFVWLD